MDANIPNSLDSWCVQTAFETRQPTVRKKIILSPVKWDYSTFKGCNLKGSLRRAINALKTDLRGKKIYTEASGDNSTRYLNISRYLIPCLKVPASESRLIFWWRIPLNEDHSGCRQGAPSDEYIPVSLHGVPEKDTFLKFLGNKSI